MLLPLLVTTSPLGSWTSKAVGNAVMLSLASVEETSVEVVAFGSSDAFSFASTKVACSSAEAAIDRNPDSIIGVIANGLTGVLSDDMVICPDDDWPLLLLSLSFVAPSKSVELELVVVGGRILYGTDGNVCGAVFFCK